MDTPSFPATKRLWGFIKWWLFDKPVYLNLAEVHPGMRAYRKWLAEAAKDTSKIRITKLPNGQ